MDNKTCSAEAIQGQAFRGTGVGQKARDLNLQWICLESNLKGKQAVSESMTRLTNHTDLPQLHQGRLDLLDVWQTLVQVGLQDITAQWMAFDYCTANPVKVQKRFLGDSACFPGFAVTALFGPQTENRTVCIAEKLWQLLLVRCAKRSSD